MGQLRKYLIVFGVVSAFIFSSASPTLASVGLKIDITGLSFKYDESQNGSLFDATSIAGGNGQISEATRVSLIDFFLGGQKVGSLVYNDGIYVDFLIDGIHNIPAGGGMVTTPHTGSAFGFDLISNSLGRFLSLDLDTVDATYTYSNYGWFAQFSFVVGGAATGVNYQDLPFGLRLDEGQEIVVSVSCQNVKNIVESGGYLSSFNAYSGTASVTGTQVPEPASFVALMAIGLIGLEIRSLAMRRRRQLLSRV